MWIRKQIVILTALFGVSFIAGVTHSQGEGTSELKLQRYKNGINNLRLFFDKIQLFRAKHGTYPKNSMGLALDVRANYTYYGFSDKGSATTAMINPDSKKLSNNKKAGITISTVVMGTNPDGSPLSAPKPKGSKSLLAYITMYTGIKEVVLNDRPALQFYGDYLVLYDDGSIEAVPADCRYMYSKPQKRNEFAAFFPLQARVPFDSLSPEETAQYIFKVDKSIYSDTIDVEPNMVEDNGGHEAVVALSRLLSYPTRYGIDRGELRKVTNLAERELTPEEIQSMTTKLGLKTQLKRLSLSALQEFGSPAILFLSDNGRFVALSALSNHSAVVFDRGGTYIVSREKLEKRYSGELLIPIAKSSRASIVADDPVREIQLKSLDEEVTQSVTLRNTGNETINLQLEYPILGVVSAQLSKETLQAGEIAVLELKLRWRTILQAPTQNVFVSLGTNDPVRPRLRLGFLLKEPKS